MLSTAASNISNWKFFCRLCVSLVDADAHLTVVPPKLSAFAHIGIIVVVLTCYTNIRLTTCQYYSGLVKSSAERTGSFSSRLRRAADRRIITKSLKRRPNFAPTIRWPVAIHTFASRILINDYCAVATQAQTTRCEWISAIIEASRSPSADCATETRLPHGL